MLDYQLIGMVVFWVVIFVANLRIWLFSKDFRVVQMFFLIGSAVLYPLIYFPYTLNKASDIYGFFGKTMSWNFVLVLVVTIGIVGLVDWCFEKTQGKNADYLIVDEFKDFY